VEKVFTSLTSLVKNMTSKILEEKDPPLTPPPATVQIGLLGEYLRAQGLRIVRHYYNYRRELVVEVIDRPIISAEIPDPDRTGGA